MQLIELIGCRDISVVEKSFGCMALFQPPKYLPRICTQIGAGVPVPCFNVLMNE